MRIRERTAWTSIDVQDSFIGRKARQHDVATGKLRNAFRDGAAISNQLLRLAAILVISGQLEARLKKPPRNGLAHVANSDKSELIVFRRDWMHSDFSFGRGPYEFKGKCLCAFGLHSHGPLYSLLCFLLRSQASANVLPRIEVGLHKRLSNVSR